MRANLVMLVALAGCGPKIDRGTAAADTAAAPVRLVTLPDASSPNVYFQAIVAAGSAWDPIGQEGVAYVAARSMIEAGADDRSGAALKDTLYPTGNDIHAVVDVEWVSFRLTCHRDHAALCLDVFADVLTAPRFEAADVARVRDEALYDVSQGLLSNDEALGDVALDVVMYEGHPYGHPVEGRAGVLPVIGADQARAYWQSRYVREAVIGGLAGAYDDDLLRAFQARLDALPAVAAPERVLPTAPQVVGRNLVAIDTTTAVTGFHLGHPLDIGRDHPDWPAFYLGIQAFGVHRQQHGRLFQTLREARGLNYGTYAYAEPFVQRGWSSMPEQGVSREQPHFSLWIRPTSLENGPFALKLAVDELEKLAADGLTPEEFDANRSYLVSHTPLDAQDPGRRLAFALDAEATGKPNVLDRVAEALPEVTLEQVNAALRLHLRPADLEIVAVSGEADDLVRRLTEETSTPIVYNDVDPSPEQAARDEEVAGKALGLAGTTIVPAEGLFR